MKVTKLIIPLLGLSQISNVNKQELLQIEKVKGLDISYQVLAVEKELNYFDSSTIATVNSASLTENLIKNEVRGPTQTVSREQCFREYWEHMATCSLLGPFAPPCILLASTNLALCLSTAT